MLLSLLLSLSTSAIAAPSEIQCCDGGSADRSLRYYLRVRESLLVPGDGRWNAQLTGWGPYIRRPSGPDLSDADREVYRQLYKEVWRLTVKNSRPEIVAAFSALSRQVAYLALRHPGGKQVVAEATCGDQYWLQPVDEELQPLVPDGCEARWLLEP